MNYEQALQYIHSIQRFGVKLGLENISNLLKHMGNPHKKLKFIHIAGTNGKGSTTVMIARILQESGYKVGMYTSPYIEEFAERIQINGGYIKKEELARLTSQVKETIDNMVNCGYSHPTEFEIVTAIAFQYYYEQDCDFVVLEVGMGGRFDATNIIDCPLISVITSISMDHTEYLGDTLEAIAFEKCGIIKDNSRVVVYPGQEEKILEVIRTISSQKKSELIVANCDTIRLFSDSLEYMEFGYKEYGRIRIMLLGHHQLFNAATAITVIEELRDYHNIEIRNEDIVEGISKARWPGRLEVLGKNPLFVIDGAHNISGVNMLEQAIKNYCKGKKLTIVMGMLKDKEYESCVKTLATLADLFIAVRPEVERGLEVSILGEVAHRYCERVIVQDQVRKAIDYAIDNTLEDGIICCCGSLYLIGDVRSYYNNKMEKR